MRNVILNLHLYAALIGGVFLIILSITGSILVFQDEIDHLINPGLFNIPAQESTLSLSTIQDVLQKKYPDKKFGHIALPEEADRPYVAQFKTTQVFINSHTGDIIGTRETPTLLDNIHTFHTRLWLGDTGRNIVAAATLLSIFLIVTGIYLWWPIRKTGTARGLSFYLHYALGLYFSLFLLILAVTGIGLYLDGIINPWIFKVTNSAPPRWNVPSTVIPGKPPLSATDALGIASVRFAGAKPVSISLPSNPQGSYAVNLRYPGDLHENRVVIDQYSGKILSVIDSRAPSPGQRITEANDYLHTGAIFGLSSQIVMSISSLVLTVQTITGYWLWWKKLRRKPQLRA